MAATFRFGPFELNAGTGELRKFGARLRLQRMPAQILAALLERPGEVVTREELRNRLWPSDTFVDFDSGLNTAANRLRTTLGDSAEKPHYIETIARTGYRFIGPVELATERVEAESSAVETSVPEPERRREWIPWAVAAFAIAAGMAIGVFVLRRSPHAVTFHQLTFRRGVVDTARFVPGTSEVVLSATWGEEAPGAYVTSTLSPEMRALDWKYARVAAISTSGQLACLFTQRSGPTKLAVAPLNGGAPKDVAVGVVDADWITPSELALVRFDSGGMAIEFPRGKTVFHTAGSISGLRVSPDGASAAFLNHPVSGDNCGSVNVVRRDGSVRTLSSGWNSVDGLAWHPRRNEIWFTASRNGIARNLYAVSPAGSLRQVASMPNEMMIADISTDGKALITVHQSRALVEGRTKGDGEVRDLSWFDWPHAQALSTDGQTLLFDESGEGGGAGGSVFVRDLQTGQAMRLGVGRAQDLSADKKWALSLDMRNPDRLSMWPLGAGSARTIAARGMVYQWARFLPDGKRLVVGAGKASAPSSLWIQEIESGAMHALAQGCCKEAIAVSPDGERIAGMGPGAWPTVVSLKTGEVRALTVRGIPVQWANDGRLVLVQRGAVSRILRMNVDTGANEAWTEFRPSPRVGTSAVIDAKMAGDLFVYSFVWRMSDLFIVEGWG